MKKIIFIIILLIIIAVILGGIIYFNPKENTSQEGNNSSNQQNIQNDINNSDIEENIISDNSNSLDETQNSQNEGEEVDMENARIKLTVNGNEVFVRLDDNQASRDLLKMLPLTLTFEDFNNTEKIATLPNELSTEGLPSGYTPQIGDFSYYAPWGNVSVFYKDFRYSSSLYKLGTIESGTEILGNISSDFEVTIESIN